MRRAQRAMSPGLPVLRPMRKKVPGATASLLVLGATSEIAVATVKEFIARYPQTMWQIHRAR